MATPQDIDKVMNHLFDEFMTGEPCCRSIFFKDGKADVGKVWSMLYKVFMKPILTDGTSIIAVNEKDEIVGKQEIPTINQQTSSRLLRYQTNMYEYKYKWPQKS